MTKDSEGDRFFGGPRPIGALLPRITRPIFRKKSPAGAQIMADWAEIIGPALAAVTAPRRLTGTSLTIACAGPVAMELAHLAPQIAARINQHLGRQAVETLRFVQEAVPAAKPQPARQQPRQVPNPGPLPDQVQAGLAEVPGEELRAALAKLARGVYRNGG
jgi:hypothetical protein